MAIGDIISRTVDFEQSKSRNRSSIKPGLDPKLDELKRRYDGVSSFLTKAVDDSSRHLAPETRKRIKSCIFLPQLGFLLVVETDPNTHDGQYVNDDEGGQQWEKVFTADGSVCYKNEAMRELDKSYGDMYCEIGGMCSRSRSHC
jgi:DNA mismatch repair protein MSH5